MYSPQEAAVVSGAPLTVIQKAITTRAVPARTVGPQKRRQLDQTALLAFALAEALPSELYLSPGAAYQLLRLQAAQSDGGELVIGDVVRIDASKALAAARRRLALYERARHLIISDPEIMGGTPTIRGTRITAQSILGRIEAGDGIEMILEEYPYLDRETVEAAALYVQANPPRGRPRGKLWRRAS
jgi:uncharacterized protein (DUF433 family)